MTLKPWTALAPVVALTFALTACGGGGGGASAPAPQPPVSSLSFDIKALGSLVAGAFGAGVAVNDNGLAVGLADDGAAVKAVKWNIAAAAPAATVLAPLTGGSNSYSAAYDVSPSDISVGESQSGSRAVAVYWPAGSTAASPLSTTGLFASGDSTAYGINAGGAIVGEATNDPLGNTVALFWASPSAPPVLLANLSNASGAFSSAYAIDDAGVIVGESLSGGGTVRPVAWLPAAGGGYGAPLELPLLTNHVAGVALNLNAAGQIVGESEAIDGTVHGVVWTLEADGTLSSAEDLGAASSASAINSLNRVAGTRGAGSGSDNAGLWTSGKADSALLGSAVSRAFDLNDQTQVVGVAGGAGFVALPK